MVYNKKIPELNQSEKEVMTNQKYEAPICPYCNQESELVDGTVMYPHRPDLSSLLFYLCHNCEASIGCHKGTSRPLGRLANKELRQYKMKAHAEFDPLWQDGSMTRTQAYELLAKEMQLNPDDCHIGMFDVDDCKKVIEIAAKLKGLR